MMTTNWLINLTTFIGQYLPPLLAGCGIGLFFFATLWITVHKGLISGNPALWFVLGMLARTGISISLFYILAAGDWQRLLISLCGFIVGRQLVHKLIRLMSGEQRVMSGVHHAP